MTLIERLRKVTWGHGAFGESERNNPSDIELEAANEIERLRELITIHKLTIDSLYAESVSYYNELQSLIENELK